MFEIPETLPEFVQFSNVAEEAFPQIPPTSSPVPVIVPVFSQSVNEVLAFEAEPQIPPMFETPERAPEFVQFSNVAEFALPQIPPILLELLL